MDSQEADGGVSVTIKPLTLKSTEYGFAVHYTPNDKNIGEIFKGDDGYYVYEPCSYEYVGMFEAWILRALADTLDELNKDWDTQVQKDLSI